MSRREGVPAARPGYPEAMCVACVAAATPEVAIALGGYAAVRFGRPLERLRARRADGDDPDDGALLDQVARPS